jgi:hypothetical protein
MAFTQEKINLIANELEAADSIVNLGSFITDAFNLLIYLSVIAALL